MIVYHTSTEIVRLPDTLHSRSRLDFGRGFYVTTLREQAVKYGERFRIRRRTAWLNRYEMSEAFGALLVRQFAHYDEEWLDFVTACRRQKDTSSYDLVIGGVANDKVFRTIDLYFAGDIDKKTALRRLQYEQPNRQFCLRSEAAIQLLTFLDAEELP